MGDRLVVIRTADLGADKQASYLEIPVENQPYLWVIGNPSQSGSENLLNQIRAIYRASWYAIWG